MGNNQRISSIGSRPELSTESGLVVRLYQKGDLKKVDELWRKHHENQFSLPALMPSIITCVVEDEQGMIAFGNLKVFAETVMVMDHDRSPIVRAKAFREIMPVAIMGAQQVGISEIHAVTLDPSFGDVLRKHFGFSNVLGEHLKLEVL